MVRRKMEIARIQDRGKLHTTFTKRRQGLCKKAGKFCVDFGADVAIITFSSTGSLYAYGLPEFLPLYTRFLDHPSSSVSVIRSTNSSEEIRVNDGETSSAKESEIPTDAEKIISEVMGKEKSAWDLALGNLELDKVNEIESVVRNLRSFVMRAREAASKTEENH